MVTHQIRTVAHCAPQLAALVTAATLVTATGRTFAAGTWSDPGTSVFNANVAADYAHSYDDPPAGCAGFNADVDGPNALAGFIQGFVGSSFGRLAVAEARDNDEPACTIHGKSHSRTTVYGVGTATLDVRWKVHADTENNCDCQCTIPPAAGDYTYDSGASAGLNATIEMEISTLPPGQQVTVYYSWWALVNNFYDPEIPPLPDDPTSVTNVTLNLLNAPLIAPNSVDFDDVKALAFLPVSQTLASGSFQAQDGDTITVDFSAICAARIRNDPDVCNMNHDFADATFNGQILLSIDSPLPSLPHPSNSSSYSSEFSLDIGSDTEMSDPLPTGNEVFDPGDMYPWFGPLLPLGGADGVRDDALAIQADYFPQAPDGPLPVTGAPTCSGLSPLLPPAFPLVNQRYDLDGSDALDVELRLILPNFALDEPLPRFASNCISDDPYFYYSFDDDWSCFYTDTFLCAGPCSVPSEEPSFPSGTAHGAAPTNDEVMMLSTTAVWPQPGPTPLAITGSTAGLVPEDVLHQNLAPNPLPGQSEDDDVDALDIATGGCAVWYVSSDHEATPVHPSSPGTFLDPGDVYEVLPLGGVQAVIDDVIHLGLPDSTDIDAFEFVWLTQCTGGTSDCCTAWGGLECSDPACTAAVCAVDAFCCATAWDGICATEAATLCPALCTVVCSDVLVLLFSVNDDDFLTPGDESGGRDPAMIYGSFLDGTNFEYLTSPLAEDIDALSAYAMPLIPPGAGTLVNDDCSRIAPVTDGDTYFNNIGATNDGPAGDPCPPLAFTGNDRDVWFEYIATCNGTATFEVDPAMFEPLLGLYQGACPQQGGPFLGCASAPAGAGAAISVQVVAGDTIVIRLGGYNGQQGSSVLRISCTTPPCPWDMNGDGNVGFFDLTQVLLNWGLCPPGPCPWDFNGDGSVGFFDLTQMLLNWGPCP